MKIAPDDTGRVIAHRLAPAGAIPNHPRWPLLVYPGAVAIEGADPAALFEALFNRNRWPAAWRNGVFPFHHLHSNAHEALGIVGAYPAGQHPDMHTPLLSNTRRSAEAVTGVPLPECDPVYGASGPLFTHWPP
jgi:uncharacterized protein YjlB